MPLRRCLLLVDGPGARAMARVFRTRQRCPAAHHSGSRRRHRAEVVEGGRVVCWSDMGLPLQSLRRREHSKRSRECVLADGLAGSVSGSSGHVCRRSTVHLEPSLAHGKAGSACDSSGSGLTKHCSGPAVCAGLHCSPGSSPSSVWPAAERFFVRPLNTHGVEAVHHHRVRVLGHRPRVRPLQRCLRQVARRVRLSAQHHQRGSGMRVRGRGRALLLGVSSVLHRSIPAAALQACGLSRRCSGPAVPAALHCSPGSSPSAVWPAAERFFVVPLPNDCIFCQIAADLVPASVVYRDTEVIAFMDIRPFNLGHLLVIPVDHAVYLSDLDSGVGGRMFQIGQQMAGALRNSNIRCEGINFFLADGEVAGQEVFHTHLHVIPRFHDDDVGLEQALAKFAKVSREELNDSAANIRSAMRNGA